LKPATNFWAFQEYPKLIPEEERLFHRNWDGKFEYLTTGYCRKGAREEKHLPCLGPPRGTPFEKTMPLQIFLNASLRLYAPGYNPYQGITLEVPPDTKVSHIISRLGLPPKEVTLIMVNGVRRPSDFPLQGDERLGLFPPIGGG